MKKRARLQSDTSTPCLFGVLRCLALTDDDAATRLHRGRLSISVRCRSPRTIRKAEKFLAEFYEHYMPWLVEPLYDCGVENNKVKRGSSLCVRAVRYCALRLARIATA